jgi:hypothetical protein
VALTEEFTMTVMELGAVLREMYNSAQKGDTVAMIHLFGIKYANEIRGSGAACKDIAISAGIPESYGVEINKGINLAKYVTLKDQS